MPERIQLRRLAGWRMPPNAVKVDRSTKWGNPFRVGDFYASRTWAHDRPHPRGTRGEPGTYWHAGMTLGPWIETIAVVRNRAHAVELFRAYIAYEDIDWSPARVRAGLAGKDLACWCPLADDEGRPVPCHADVLLEVAAQLEAVTP